MRFRRSNPKQNQQGGYVLLAILFALTVLIVGLAVAAPKATTALQRTKEDELIRRGEQYALAIRRFYKKFGRYPSSVDQLENTNNIRFLRRRYLDPLTGKDDWAPIQYGQARPPLGFFGQKITTVGGLSPSGPGLGPSNISQSLGGTANSPSTDTGSNSANSFSISSTNAASSGTAASGISTSGTSGSSSPFSSANGPAGGAGNPLSSDQLSGRTFGGGSIVGVSVPSQKQSLKEFQQKDHYNDWQFVYDPTQDPTLRGGLGVGSANGVPGTAGSTFTNGGGLNPGGLSPGGLNPTSPMTNQTTGGTSSNPH